MLEMMKGYVQLAAGLGEMSRRRAMDAARDLLEGTTVTGLRNGTGAAPEALAGQVAAVADELLTIGRQNRRLLAQLVRTETEAVLASVGVRPDRTVARGAAGERLEDQLRALRDRVDDLERQLRERAGRTTGTVTSGTRTASARRSNPTTRRRPSETATAKRATKATAKRATKATAKRATKATAKRATKATAKRATKATAKRATKATGTRAAHGQGHLMTDVVPASEEPASPAPGPPHTGDALVDGAIEDLLTVMSRPLEEQVEVYVGVHRKLQDRLADLDG